MNIIAFSEENKYQVSNEKDASPDNCPTQTFSLMLHVHERPRNKIRFVDGEKNEYPVKQLHPGNESDFKKFWP